MNDLTLAPAPVRVRRQVSNSYQRKPDGSPRFHTYSLTLPPLLGQAMYGVWEFQLQVTEQGLLYVPVNVNPEVELHWLDQG